MRYKNVILIMSLMICSGAALAHARLVPGAKNFVVRDTNPGIKVGPCGPASRKPLPTILEAGQEVTVEWEETVQHPGRFEFSFSKSNDTDFTMVKSVPDVMNNTNDLPHRYSTTLRVPATACEQCTLQMIQVMTEDPANPRNYFSCADIKIVPAGTDTASMPAPTVPVPADPSLPKTNAGGTNTGAAPASGNGNGSSIDATRSAADGSDCH